MKLPCLSHLSLLHRLNLPEQLLQQNSLASSLAFPRPSIWLSIAVLNHHCQVYGQPIKHVFNFQYLGSMMASSVSDQTRWRALAWVAFWKLEAIWRSPSISISTKIKLFNTTCVTVLLCGCESWVISGDKENKINAFATSYYRIMLNIKRLDCVSNERIYHLTNTQPLINTVRQRQLRFLGHILRMPEEEPCRRYALYVPTHSRRRPGRQRTSYLSYLQKLFGMQKMIWTKMQLPH